MINIDNYKKSEVGGDKDSTEDSLAVLKILLQYPFIKRMLW